MGTKQGMSKANARIVVRRGMILLREAGLEPFYGTAMLYCQLFPDHPHIKEIRMKALSLQTEQTCANIQQDWTKWYLLLEGEKHYSKFKSYDDWRKHYGS
jgi:hypothetical protein